MFLKLDFQTKKIPQRDRGAKNHFGFIGQVDFNRSNMTWMVFFYKPQGGAFD
jgi:hypothetical protein